jgi:T4 superinfection immunity protein
LTLVGVDVLAALADKLSQIWATLSGVSVLWALLAIAFALAMYFLPPILAAVLGHPPGRVAIIAILDLFLGWTGLGWFALLGWAMIGRPRAPELEPIEEGEWVPSVHPPTTG